MIQRFSDDGIILRRAHPGDRPSLIALQKLSLEALCSEDYQPEEIAAIVKDKSDTTRWKWGDVVFIAEDHTPAQRGTIVGFAARLGDWVSAVYIHPDYVRRGIGRRLLDLVEADGRANQIYRMRVKAALTAVPFYKACGYDAVHTTSIHVQEVWVPCVDMQKWIQRYGAAESFDTSSHCELPERSPSKPVWETVQAILCWTMLGYGMIKLIEWLMSKNP